MGQLSELLRECSREAIDFDSGALALAVVRQAFRDLKLPEDVRDLDGFEPLAVRIEAAHFLLHRMWEENDPFFHEARKHLARFKVEQAALAIMGGELRQAYKKALPLLSEVQETA